MEYTGPARSDLLWILDNDDTIVNSGQFIRPAHAKAIMQIAKVSFEEAEKIFAEKGTSVVEEFGIDVGDFYKNIYQAPKYKELGKQGAFTIYEDAKQFLQRHHQQSTVVSNINEEVTRMKLEAAGAGHFQYAGVFGAASREKRKPNLHLAYQALEAMDKKGLYHPNHTLMVVGDLSYDIEFAENIKNNIHKNTVSVLIDRGHGDAMKKKPDMTIQSFSEICNI